jgi:alkylhydroperoxidase family enzyme
MTAGGGRVPDGIYAPLRAAWSETAVVEIAAVAAAFAMYNRLANALQVEVTP